MRKINWETKLCSALKSLLHNSINIDGTPKKATVKQLKKARDVVSMYEKAKDKQLKDTVDGITPGYSTLKFQSL